MTDNNPKLRTNTPRMMNSAPELLAALELMVEQFETSYDDDPKNSAYVAAKKAIARATGGDE